MIFMEHALQALIVVTIMLIFKPCFSVININRYHIDWSVDPSKTIEEIYGDAVPDLMGEEPKDQSKAYPTLTMYVSSK